jgi:small conductance mechanosensitive channel
MMLFVTTLILRLYFIAAVPQLPLAQAAPNATVSAGATTTVSIPTSQPTSQPAVNLTVNVPPPTTDANVDPSVNAWSNTTLNQIIQGKRKLELREVIDPHFWVSTINNLVLTLLAFIPRLLGTLLFLLVFWLIYRGIRRMAVRNMKQGEVDSSIRDLLASLIKWVVMGFGIVIACNQLGIPIVAMLTGVSIIGLAVGFAAQETLANFIAGIVIFLDKPFKVGDWIQIDGTFGQVKRVSFRSTRILDLDGEVIVLPNTHMLSTKVANHTTHPLNRVSIPVGISYRASIDDARKALLALTEGDARLAKEPPPEVIVASLGDSAVNLVLRMWILNEALEKKILYEYTEKAKNALDAAGVEIPFPHLQLFIEDTKAIARLGNRVTAA